MNKGMQFLFKSLGIEISPETMAMLAALIPQLPAKINEAAQAINGALANFDARLRALEARAIAHEAGLDAIFAAVLDNRDNSACFAERLKTIQEVLDGHTSRISNASGSSGAGRRSSRANGGTITSGNDGGSGDIS